MSRARLVGPELDALHAVDQLDDARLEQRLRALIPLIAGTRPPLEILIELSVVSLTLARRRAPRKN